MRLLTRSFSVTTLLILLAGISCAQDNRRDGNWWRNLEKDSKVMYMVGFFDWMSLGKKMTTWRLIKQDKTQIDCFLAAHKSFTEYNNKYFALPTSSQIVDGLDDFYKDYKNRAIEIDSAVWVVVRQIAGDSNKDVDDLVQNLRKYNH